MKKLLKIIIAPLGILIFIIAISLLSHEMKNYSYQQILDTLRAIPSFKITIALILSLSYYLILGGYDVIAFKYIGVPLKFKNVLFTCFVSNALGNNTGYSMLFGGSIRYRLYSLYNVSMMNVTKVLFFSSATIWFGLLIIGGLVFTFSPVEFNNNKFFFSSSFPLGILFLTIVLLYTALSLLKSKPIKILKWTITFPSIKITLWQMLLATADWVLASCTLYVLLPQGEIAYITLLQIFLIAQMLGILSQVPGGMGVFETAIVMMLPSATESSYVMGALLAYRAIFYFFPLGIALILLASHEFFRAKKRFKVLARFYGGRMASIIPQALSVSIFFGGTIILFSGVTTVSSSIIQRLVEYIPSIILDLLHFLISIIGIMLLFVSRGLILRIKKAYSIAIILLSILFPLALINGYGYEKIVSLIIILSLIIPAKKYFYRTLSLMTLRLNILWFSAISIVFLTSTWLGFFVYKQDIYSWTNFLESLFSNSDASRFLRICMGMAIIMIMVLISEIFKRYKYKKTTVNVNNVKKLVDTSKYVYGNYAFENKNIFDMNTNTFMMYYQINNSAIAFGDPVGDNKSSRELIWNFKEMTDLKNIKPTFIYLGYKNLKIYDDIGLDIASFGADANILLDTFSVNENSLMDIKKISDNMENTGYSFEVIEREEFVKVQKYIGFVDYQWEQDFAGLKNKMFDVSSKNANKYIVIKKDNFISAYAYLLLSDNKYESFVSNIRYTNDCNNNIVQFILFKAISWAKNNQYKWFNLGLTPNDKIILDDDFIKKAKIFVFAEHFKYDMNTLIEFKNKFNPVWKNKYVAFSADKHIKQFLSDFFYIYS
ncbi:MAG: phosphatidylglycerol lysyltransferase domain-containing protein [Endomicrobiaceae bacterium]|nr:phosphatidylglycerol lysyltransferase domain-containing protein [Endomicrobiaceae bacterium]MDD3922655.1 phosphatidylglycerol lysyltransferase domain-containing protein [Endomicrobiaceae bacterium]